MLLSQEERRALEQCPADLPELIGHWFLVTEAHDDCGIYDKSESNWNQQVK